MAERALRIKSNEPIELRLGSYLRSDSIESRDLPVNHDEAAVDYHRVSIAEDYEQVLIRFLVGRTRSRGVR